MALLGASVTASPATRLKDLECNCTWKVVHRGRGVDAASPRGGDPQLRIRSVTLHLTSPHQSVVAGVAREVAWQELVESRAREGRGGGSEGIYSGFSGRKSVRGMGRE
jgi:hypothetical protein